MLYEVEIEPDLIFEFREELENSLLDVEGILIALENQPWNESALNNIRNVFHNLWISTIKLQLVPISESLDDLIKALDKFRQWEVYPDSASEYLLLLADRIFFLTKEVERNFVINIQETQHILVSLQHIILAESVEEINEGVVKALHAITQNISINSEDEHTDKNIDLFSDSDSVDLDCTLFSDSEPDDANIVLFSDSESIEPEMKHTTTSVPVDSAATNQQIPVQPPTIIETVNPQIYAVDYIASLKNESAIKLLADISDKVTSPQHSHTEFMLELCIAINFIAGKPIDEEALAKGILLHDVALSAIPDIINKTEKLTSEEVQMIRMHPMQGSILAEAMQLPEESLILIAHHHERMDGKGYPYGLRNDQISDSGKLVGIVDSFHSMVDNRAHKKYQRSPLRAVAEINAGVNLHYDKLWIKFFNRYMKDQWLLAQKKLPRSINKETNETHINSQTNH